MTSQQPADGRSPRRKRIEAMLSEDPDDTFLRYSLALAMEADGELDGCLDILESLGRGSPPYLPALQMAGQFLAKRGRLAAARQALREGIEEGRRQGKAHAVAEMAELLASLGAAGESD